MIDSDKIQSSASPWVKAILISAAFTALYLLIAGSSTLWDRDEPRYARVTVEMVESGNYLVPTFNGEVWFDKPVLLYWLMSVPVRLLGPSEIACRLPGVLGTAVTLLLTFFIGKKLFDAKVALWSEAILGTTLLMLFVGSSALVDAIAMPFIVGAMAIFVNRLGNKIRAIDATAIGILMGFGMLAKGPIGLMPVPVMVVCLFLTYKKLFLNLAFVAVVIATVIGILMGFGMLAKGPIGLIPVLVIVVYIWFARKNTRDLAFDAAVIGILIGLIILANGLSGQDIRTIYYHGEIRLIKDINLITLVKGLIVLVIELIAVTMASIWFTRKNAQVAFMVILAMGIFCIWAIPANKAMDGELFRVFFGHHIFDRAISPMESHGGNFLLYLPYYPAIMVAGFFPWVIFLPGAFSASLGKRIGNAKTRNILLSWIIVTVILMTFAATKLPHYILFAWPAMAVMTGATIVASGQNVLNERDRKWLRGGVWFSGPVGLGIAAGLIGVGYFIKSEGLIRPGLICGALALVMTIICCYLQVREKFNGTAKAVLAGVPILIISLLFVLLPAIEAIKISPHIAKAIREKTGKDVPVAMYKYAEPTLNFYVGRNIAHLRKTDDVVEWLKGTGNRALIIPRKDFEDIRQNAGDITFEEIASQKGVNYSKGREVEVIALLVKTQTRQ